MTESELAILDFNLSKSKNYLEFGSGNSTLLALDKPSIQRIDSIEGSSRYYNKVMLKNDKIQENLNKKLFYHYIDLGPTGAYSFPTDKTKYQSWPAYYKIINNLPQNWDLVLVDGRFRKACLLTILLLNRKINILIHDFWNRNEYHFLLNYLEIIDSADTMGSFIPKDNINQEEISRLIQKYAYDTA